MNRLEAVKIIGNQPKWSRLSGRIRTQCHSARGKQMIETLTIIWIVGAIVAILYEIAV
jgi:hypothetical protein